MKKTIFSLLLLTVVLPSAAQQVQLLPFGNFDQWITRNIKESGVIGGKQKTIYAIGPTQTINGQIAYHNKGGSPWATSNVNGTRFRHL